MPLLQTTCPSGQIYNSTEYGCYSCPTDFINIENVCRPSNATFIVANTNPIKYVSACNPDQFKLGLVCFPNNTIDSYIENLKKAFIGKYYDVIKDINSEEYDQISTQINDEYIEQYAFAELFHVADPFNQTAVGLLSNACAVFNYDSLIYPCIQFRNNFSLSSSGGRYNYLFWPNSGPFISYGENYPLKYIIEEDYITKSYKIGDYVSFQLGRFSKYGEFKGFTQLSIDFQKCGDSYDVINDWQKFGYNYYSDCFIDLKDLILTDSTDLFDIFLEDGTYEGKTILRPVPVILKNYRGINGNEVNREKSDTNHRAIRRFFMNDNYTSDEVYQHLKSFMITFNIKSDDKKKMLPPIITIEYSQIRKNDIENHNFEINIDSETISTPKYLFEVRYTRSMNGFWQALKIVFGLLMAVDFLYFLVFMFMFIRIYAVDGCRCSSIFGLFGYLLDIFSTVLFIVAFAFSFYIFIFFKFQNSSYIFLPEEEEFSLLIPVLLVAMPMKFFAVIFIIILKSSTNVFIIDWENPKEEDIPVSGWRRIIVANEWNRILTVRHYNTAFTVLGMAFIIGGFNLNLLSSPIPSTKLVDMDKEYLVLRFAFTSFIWLLLILFQLLITKFVIWPIFGNPFYNFIDLCSTSNVSVFIRTCSFQGYYIHGKSPHSSADEDLDKLSSNLRNESNGLAPKRGLFYSSSDQVFEVFLADEFRHQLDDLYNSQLAQTGIPSVLNFRQHVAGDIPHAAYETNKEVNDFLKHFFIQDSDYKYGIRPKDCVQSFFDIPPIVIDESTLIRINDSGYQKSLICGIEWKLQLLYLLIFACIGIISSSPCIPALVVFTIDFIFVKIFNLIGRSSLSKKTLLDDRFFL